MTRPDWLPPVEPDEFSEAVDGRTVPVEAYPLWARHRRVPPPPPAEVVRLVPVARITRVPLGGLRVAVVGLIAVALGEKGVTRSELEEEASWRSSVASPSLTRAERAGLVRKDGRVRDGQAVYVAVTA